MEPVPMPFLRAAQEREVRVRMSHRIPLAFQGAIFQEGEVVEVKGERFVVQKIIRKGLVLHGLPGLTEGVKP